MAAPHEEPADLLNATRDITTCCICTQTYVDPRILPCSHTYCFKCLPTIQKANTLRCALCRQQFDNLSANLENLPKNAFIQKVVHLVESPIDSTSESRGNESTNESDNGGFEIKPKKINMTNLTDHQNVEHKLSITETSKQQVKIDKQEAEEMKSAQTYRPNSVDICAENSDGGTMKREAMAHCTNFEQNQCSMRSKEHAKQKLPRNRYIEPPKVEPIKAKTQKERDRGEILCQVCAEDEEFAMPEIPRATMHCTTCSESQCSECNRAHIRQKAFKSHHIVFIDDNMKKNLLKKKELTEVKELKIVCDVCKENESRENDCEIKTATQRCMDCCENQCSDCSREHKKQRSFKQHQIVEIGQKLKETVFKEMIFRCENNDNGVTDLAIAKRHCIHCNENQCDQCSKEHKRQSAIKNETIVLLPEMKARFKHLKGAEESPESKKPGNQHAENIDHQPSSESESFITDCSEPKEKEKAMVAVQSILKEANLTDQQKISADEAFESLILDAKEHQPLANASSEGGDYANQLITTKIEPFLQDEVFSRIHQIIEKPTTNEEHLASFWENTMPYIIQRLKMWNGEVITAQSLESLVKRPPKRNMFSKTASLSSKATGSSPRDTNSDNPVSRLDCLTYIINAADYVVAQDLFRILSKFPIAIPFVIQDISKENKYIKTTSLVENNVVKWESTPGHIAENYLFSSPFRMVVAVRLGTNKLGKSTILNQLMRKKFVFSSKFEAGSSYGRPRTLDGSVEIVWLTQETCCEITWKSTMLDFYRENTKEVAILANLHGNALQYPDTLKYLTGLALSFIVFLMPDFSPDALNQFKKITSGKVSVHVLVDPKEDTNEDLCLSSIYTDSLASHDTLEILRSALGESLNQEISPMQPVVKQTLNLEDCLSNVHTETCTEAEEIINTVKARSCFKIRQILHSAILDEPRKWGNEMKQLVRLFIDIHKNQAKKSLMFLETQLSRLSATESANARAEVSRANERLRCFVKAPSKSNPNEKVSETKHAIELKQAQEELKLAMEKVDKMNLGQEHFVRVLGLIYEKSVIQNDVKDQIPSITDLPSCFADLLISGQAIEVLNGDSGQIQFVWIKAICESVCKKLPNLKVFVISIIGVQSSGKSTLLNALFSCRFAVSVGRCSRGLFMRLIFLDDYLRKTLGCDCIILIDTEGLCSPEKMNDPKANHKDRLMATFAMGVSNLVIVNILGEGMTEMTEILQIAIVAMARLRSGGIKPDILMVQHLQERNVSKIDQAKGQFCDAVNKAFELINKNDIEIGSASAECLAELTARIQSGDLFQHFGPFKDGSSVNAPPAESYHEDIVSLFETLVKRVKAMEKKLSFEHWSHHFESYWTCVQEENFALNFRNVKHITDFLYFEKKIAKVKELLDNAFRKHSNEFVLEMKNEISVHVRENKKLKTDLIMENIVENKQEQLKVIPQHCQASCEVCKYYRDSYYSLLVEMSGNEWEEDTKKALNTYNCTLQERTGNLLRQIFHGSVVRQGCFSEFSDVIVRELNQALKNRPDGIYSSKEQEDITNEIWRSLKGIASSKGKWIPVEDRFTIALHQEYASIIPNILIEFRTGRRFESLCKEKADNGFPNSVKKFWTSLFYTSKDEMDLLLNNVENLIARVFQNRSEDYLTTGLDFDGGMLRYFRNEFPDAVSAYEKQVHVKLTDRFKMDLQMFALQQLQKQTRKLQKVWNQKNRPIDILLQKKDEYLEEIKTTLQSGFTCAGEGKKVAARLGKAIEKSAIKAVYNAKVDSLRSSVWTTNSEKVRLTYFEELAKEVKSGKKERALNHFQNPERGINQWFREKVESIRSTDKLQKIFNSSRSTDLRDILEKVQHSTSKEDIDEIIKFYITDVEDGYCCPLNPKDNNFDAYKNNILHELSRLKTDKREVTLPSIANDPEVRRRLGCTTHCFWCGALCWGSPDHQLEKESNPEMECHHSCHQPTGLKGTYDRNTRALISVSCHNYKDDWKVLIGEFSEDDEGILWSEAKQNHFPDWKFDAHCITKFDDLMRWFFQELHQDIAKSRNLFPANLKELEETRCTNLKLEDILKVVQSKI